MQQKVLLIEDSAVSMKLLQKLVVKSGFEPVCAEDLVQARHIFSHSKPEEYLCSVVDYNLPDAPDGEAIDYSIEAFIPTVVITGNLDEATRDKVLSKDVVDYIPKENTQVYDYLSRLLARLQKNKAVGVLVVDDSRISRSLAISLLQRHNFVTYEAADGVQGLEMLQQHADIKLVLTDENMPNKTGLEMVCDIRRTISKEHLAIIGLSSKGSSALSARFIKSGANDYLTKPYCLEEFFCRVLQNVEYIENIEAIRHAANSDYLTGLPNRRHFFVQAKACFNDSERSVPTACMAIMDIDHFKTVNDTYGHDMGDEVLRKVAGVIQSSFEGVPFARMGGEEFCVFFPSFTLNDAFKLAEKFRQEVEDLHIEFEQQTINVTLSIGLTDQYDGNVEQMLKLADENLYKAKHEGRNQTVANWYQLD